MKADALPIQYRVTGSRPERHLAGTCSIDSFNGYVECHSLFDHFIEVRPTVYDHLSIHFGVVGFADTYRFAFANHFITPCFVN
jgi:hypothetical protein